MARTKPKPKQPDAAPDPAPFDFLTYYPNSARLLARWTNAVAILNTLSEEFQDLAAIANASSASLTFRPDRERLAAVSRDVLAASEEASAIPFRGNLDAIPK